VPALGNQRGGGSDGGERPGGEVIKMNLVRNYKAHLHNH
jgi:hypothetical protein